jgi:hypothetical protein
MGVNVEASNVALPTSRCISMLRRWLGRPADKGGPLDHARANVTSGGPLRRLLIGLKRSLLLANQVADESYRQLVVSWYRLRGCLVVLDRDFFADYYAYDIADNSQKSFTRRVHGFLLRRFYRRPDLFLYLDADPQTMFDRKGEGTIELLEQRRQDYLHLANVVEHFTFVDATQPLDTVVAEVKARIVAFQETRQRATGGRPWPVMAEGRKGA